MPNNLEAAGKPRSGKKMHLEILRILACFFVIFLHTGDDGYFLFSRYAPGTMRYGIYIFISIASRFTIPLFFAISGALLLPKEESIKTVYRKRVLRMCIVLFLASLFYFLRNRYLGMHTMGIGGFVSTMYYTEHSYHLWYLYTYIPYLMALPLLRPMVKSFKNEHFLYMMLCFLFFTAVLPIGEYFVWQGKYTVNSSFNMSMLAPYILVYPFTGYYIEHRMDVKRAKKYLPYLWLVNLAAILLCCVATDYKVKVTGVCDEPSSQAFHNSCVLINMAAVYISVKCWLDGKEFKPALVKALSSLGDCTFGIYLIHIVLVAMAYRYGILDFLVKTAGINEMIAALIFCALVMTAGYVIIWLVKKIPLVNKLI